MVAAILSIGTELTRGEVIDRNGPLLAGRLTAMGFDVRAMCCVDDDVGRITEAVQRLAAHSAVLVTSGGTGPGSDDCTVRAVAQALGVGTQLHEPTLHTLRRRAGADPVAEQRAEVPEGAEVLGTLEGLAPAFRVRLGDCAVYVLPGTPEEAERAADEVLTRHLVHLASPRGATRVLRTYGLNESAIAARLVGVASRFDGVTVVLRPVLPEVEVRVIVRDEPSAPARARVDAAAGEVRAALGDAVFGEDDDAFAGAVGRGLRARGYTLAVAEACTGGLIGAMLTAVPGSSEYLLLDAVTYANTAKERVLGVAPELLRGYGAVSPECVRAMAVGALRVSGADLALSVSGVAGPTGGSAERPVGMVFFALATDDHVEVVERRFQGDRAAVQRQAAYAALEMVRARCRGRMPARLPADCG
jgi:nicotinamide-nucleotide amidase